MCLSTNQDIGNESFKLMDMQSDSGTSMKTEQFTQHFTPMTVYEFRLDKNYRLEVGSKIPEFSDQFRFSD